jgi:hypothetical protein
VLWLALALGAGFGWRSIDAATAPGAAGSVRGLLSMIDARTLVLGEQFEVEVALPAPPAGAEDRVRYSLYWTRAFDNSTLEQKQAQNRNDILLGGRLAVGVDMVTSGTDVPSEPRRRNLQALAPYEAPGRAELRLYRTGAQGDDARPSGTLLDVLTVTTVVGRVEDGVVLGKRSYAPGETIAATVTLPADRFLSGVYGPALEIRPVTRDGKPMSVQAIAAFQLDCGRCALSLGELVVGRGNNRYGVGRAIVPGTYVVDERVADRIGTLTAPPAPGRYELRLYDRQCYGCLGAALEEFERNAYYFASTEFVVASSSGIDVKFVREGDATATSMREIPHGTVFFVEVSYARPAPSGGAAEQSVTLQWLDDKGASQEKAVAVTRVAEGVYRSGPLVLTRPAGS